MRKLGQTLGFVHQQAKLIKENKERMSLSRPASPKSPQIYRRPDEGDDLDQEITPAELLKRPSFRGSPKARSPKRPPSIVISRVETRQSS